MHSGKSTSQARRRPSVLVALGWYVHEIVVGITKYAREANWIVDDLPSHHGDLSSVWAGDGIITLVTSREHHRALIDLIRRSGRPVVDLSDQLPELPFARVLPDNEAIGRMAADHFIARGFEHYAFFTVDSRAPVVRERLGGFKRRVEEAGREFHLLDFSKQLSQVGGANGVLPLLARKLKQLPKPLATMAQYDREALDIIRAAQMARLMVPNQVAVVGVDNDPIYCELGAMPLSSVVSNREMVGYRGAQLLDRLMRGGAPPQSRSGWNRAVSLFGRAATSSRWMTRRWRRP